MRERKKREKLEKLEKRRQRHRLRFNLNDFAFHVAAFSQERNLKGQIVFTL